MNRIYQGKVTGVELRISGNKENPWQPLDLEPKAARAKWQAAEATHPEGV